MKEINIFTFYVFFCICFVYEMASEVPKKMIKIQGSFTVSLQTRFGLGGIISNAAICFPSHRSLFIRCRFRAECSLEVNVLHFLGRGFV